MNVDLVVIYNWKKYVFLYSNQLKSNILQFLLLSDGQAIQFFNFFQEGILSVSLESS